MLQSLQINDPSFEDSPASTTTPNGGVGWQIDGGFVVPAPGVYVLSNSSGKGITSYGDQFLEIVATGSDTQTLVGPFVLGLVYNFTVEAADVAYGTVPELT